jgi:hypothetical protein
MRRASLTDKDNLWVRRFRTAAIVQGAVIVGLTIFLVVGQISIIKARGVHRYRQEAQGHGLLLAI